MSKAGAKMIAGLREAVAVARGELLPAALYEMVTDEFGVERLIAVKGDDAKRAVMRRFIAPSQSAP